MATIGEKKKLLEEKKYKAMTALTNLQSFKDWSFAAYKVEEHEKDIVIEALQVYMYDVERLLKTLQEAGDDDTELCE